MTLQNLLHIGRLKAHEPTAAVMQCALAAMLAKGYRPSTSEPGHHQTMIQSLPLTLGVGNDVWVLLDALRRQRNASDCTGAPTTADLVRECRA